MAKKIVFIGSGSLVFTRNLVRDLLTFEAFRDAEIALVDINETNLALSKKAVDGIVEKGEECDDGNTSNDDMCTTKCTLPICGDGIVSPSLGEVCDDGKNDGSYGGCGLGCTYASPKCGDGVVDKYSGEECDDGDSNGEGYGRCSTQCKYNERCGDGVVQSEYEFCDDGEANGTSASSCPLNCLQEIN